MDNDVLTNETIVVVSGLPRSGTSLMMNMLEKGGMTLLKDEVRAADEDNPRGYYEYERVKKLGEGDLSWLSDAQGKVVKIISYLLLKVPDSFKYRVIFMQRNLSEILASQRKMLINRGEDPEKTDEVELANILERHLAQVDQWIRDQPYIAKLDCHYRQIIENPEEQAAVVNQFLGGSLDIQKMLSVIDTNLYRQRV
jgi:hypothetical protein